MTKATWKGAILAESDKCEEVEGNKYFPPDSVNMEYLKFFNEPQNPISLNQIQLSQRAHHHD